MSKITISRLVEVTKALATEAGQQLSDFISQTAALHEQVLRALRNGLTLRNNFNADIKTLELTHNTAQAIATDGGEIEGVIPLRVVSTTTGIDALSWYINNDQQLEVKVNFIGSPADPITCKILILYV